MARVGVLVSGSGTNLQALIDAGIPIAVVVSDRPGVQALARAAEAGIATEVVDREDFIPDRRVEYTERVAEVLRAHEVDVVASAGFMTILSKPIFDAFDGRIVNTHPSLLPAFRGAHAVEEALDHGVKVSGCTIHVMTADVDAGPILAQEAVPVEDGDTVETLHRRIKAVEHRLYPQVVRRLLDEIGEGER